MFTLINKCLCSLLAQWWICMKSYTALIDQFFTIAFYFFKSQIYRLQLYSDRWYQILWFLSIYMSVCVRILLYFCIYNEFFLLLILGDESPTFKNILLTGKFDTWTGDQKWRTERMGKLKNERKKLNCKRPLKTVSLSQIVILSKYTVQRHICQPIL